MKTIFWYQGHSDIPCAHCPFLGVKIKDVDEFINFVKTRLYRKVNPDGTGYYPPVIFDTMTRDFKIVFRGSCNPTQDISINPLTNQPYRWWLMDNRNLSVVKFFDRNSFEEMFECFPDSSDIDAEVQEIDDIIKTHGGFAVKF